MDDDRPGDDCDRLPARREPDSSPEEQELAFKRDELTRLHEKAVALEESRELLLARVESFNIARLQRLGRLYARSDELDLAIAESQLAREPDNPVLQRRVQEARERARLSLEAAQVAEELGPPTTIYITEELKKLYRDAARLMHPDLGRTEEERELRHTFMVMLNGAYLAGDAEAIQDLRARWEAMVPPPEALGVAEELVRVIRAIARLKKTVHRLDREIMELRCRPDCKLMVRVTRAEAEGRDLLGDMEATVRRRIEEREARLRDLEQDDAA